jgi:hypothetical protein
MVKEGRKMRRKMIGIIWRMKVEIWNMILQKARKVLGKILGMDIMMAIMMVAMATELMDVMEVMDMMGNVTDVMDVMEVMEVMEVIEVEEAVEVVEVMDVIGIMSMVVDGMNVMVEGTMEVVDGMAKIVVEDGGTDGRMGEVVRLGERVEVILCRTQPGVVACSPPPRRWWSWSTFHFGYRFVRCWIECKWKRLER